VEKVAPSDANVLILGENGTGKQVVAHEIHNLSPRAHSAFMHVDLGSLNENLFESELFGHAKGAFTDAREDKPGRFELAEDGTFFLDEIGNLPLSLQGKLLTVLQNRKVIRLGENKERPFDIRLISATNQPVYEMVQKGSFREDLLYRINTVTIELPPLRERREDILSLARHFLQIYAHKYHKVETTLDARAKKALANYNWPGNIRELQHVIERAVIMSEDNLITDADLNLVPLTARNKTAANEKLDLETMEKAWIRKALKKHNGNISKASEDLGLTRAALYRRMDKYGI
jgi:transcriptional regulator with PAS, ATPase and Fis domain